MAVDYISALNAGSGLNSTQIVDALVDAERLPKEERLTKKIDEKTVSISSLSKVKTEFTTLQTTLEALDETTGLSASSSEASIGIAITDPSEVSQFSYTMDINQLATSHTLVFDGYTSATDSVGSGSLSFDFGTWSDGTFAANADLSSQTVTIPTGEDTLEEVRDAINDADIGVLASILQTGVDSYSLIVQATSGADYAMRISATETSGDAGLTNLDFSAYDANLVAQDGQDAIFTVDGVTITRSTNTIDDLFDGVTVTLNYDNTDPVTAAVSYDTATAYEAISIFVEELNRLSSLLKEYTNRGSDGAPVGALAGDPLMRSFQNKLRTLTTTALEGFNDNQIYLTSFGITTERDGTLTLDYDDFVTAFESDPDSFAAIMNTRVTTDNRDLTASIVGDSFTPGNYSFVLSSGTPTIDGVSMTTDGNFHYSSSGDTSGLYINTTETDATASVYMGRSLIDTILAYADDVLARGSDINTKISDYSDDLSDYELELADLSSDMEAARERYMLKFGTMESAVKSLKDTGSYLTQFMDSMTKDN
ncbi:flagellar filament capping protein FliD [Alphaproteobacteria bacterium]|nr:flagellar filament capping protein FliD [Alphaproteobacteria bacterium]